jgi:RNA polymerase sigma-70 factor (ECF subfamily)
MGPTWDVRTEQGYLACYRATFHEVYRYAAMLCGSDRSAAEDVVHDVYVATLRAARRGAVTDISVGYLTTAVRHRFLDRVRSSQREERRLRLVSSTPEPEPASMPPQLSDLPDRERAILVLRYVDDLPMADAAAAMGLSLSAAESLAARAMRRLRRQEARDAE